MSEPTAEQILAWLENQPYIIVERSYQAIVSKRTEEEKKTNGYGKTLNFFTLKTQLIEGAESITAAVKIAMEKEQETQKGE